VATSQRSPFFLDFTTRSIFEIEGNMFFFDEELSRSTHMRSFAWTECGVIA